MIGISCTFNVQNKHEQIYPYYCFVHFGDSHCFSCHYCFPTSPYNLMFMLLGPTDPNFGRWYSKMIIVYCTCMNLQADFVRVMSFQWIITSVLTKIGHDDRARSQRSSTVDRLTFSRELLCFAVKLIMIICGTWFPSAS